MPEYGDIRLIYIRELIPAKLFSKLQNNHVLTVQGIIDLESDVFRSFRSVGETIHRLFEELKRKIIEDPDEILECYQKNCIKELPLNLIGYSDAVQVFEAVIEDYLKIAETRQYKTPKETERTLRNIDIFRKSYGLQSNTYDKESIGRRYRLDPERIRQISEEFIEEIRGLLHGRHIRDKGCFCKPEVLILFNSFTVGIAGQSLISEKMLKNMLRGQYSEPLYNQKRNYIHLLLRVLGYEQILTARYIYLRNDHFFSDGSVPNELFLNVADTIIRFLRKKVIPYSLDDIIIEIRNNYDISDAMIKSICEMISQVERVDLNIYQIKFEFLPKIQDYAYRVLNEEQRSLTCEELLYLINRKLVHTNKCIDLTVLKRNLRKNRYIEPVGKMGSWSLRHAQNTESQLRLILRTLRLMDRPLSIREITGYINNVLDRKDVSYKSVAADLNNYRDCFIRLADHRIALSEAAHLYVPAEVIRTARRRPERESKGDITAQKAIAVLRNSGNRMPLKELVSTVRRADRSIPISLVYKIINERPLLFHKEGLYRNKVVTLNQE